jgi:hypothetical protein
MDAALDSSNSPRARSRSTAALRWRRLSMLGFAGCSISGDKICILPLHVDVNAKHSFFYENKTLLTGKKPSIRHDTILYFSIVPSGWLFSSSPPPAS